MHHRIHDRRDMYDKATEGEADAFVATVVARKGLKVFDAGNALAYVNDGRWVVDCTECNSGIAASPGQSPLVCIECGARFVVSYPGQALRRGIESTLLKRHWKNRHWRPGETLAQLAAENERIVADRDAYIEALEERLRALAGST